MPLVALMIGGLLVALSLARPDKAGEICAVGGPAGLAAFLYIRREGRRMAGELDAEERETLRLAADNDALAARLAALRRRTP